MSDAANTISVDLFFLNKYGAVESFRFDRVRRDNFTSVKNTYRKNPYTLNNSSGTYTYDRLEHSKSDYYNEMTQRTTLNSNFITEAEAVWLKQLINSPRVWMYDTELIPINIVTSDYEQKYHINDKVFNLTLEVEHSFIDKAQVL
jgi:RNAse (barnase) inhibitor barstar